MPENEIKEVKEVNELAEGKNTKTALVNGNIHVENNAIVDALLIEAGRITGLGSAKDFKFDDDTEIIDLEGKTVLPGFCDAHAGLMKWALSQENVSIDDISASQDYDLLSKLFKVYGKKAASLGITEIWSDDMAVFGNNFSRMWNFFISQVAMSDNMPFRLRNYINISDYDELAEFIASGLNSSDGIPFCHTGPVKILCDGVDPEKINKIINTAHLAGLQIAAQADSGAAINMCLEAFENAVKQRAMTTRHLIIHAKSADTMQIKRMRDLRLGVVIEPEMATHSESGCRWRELLRSGITFCSGSGAGLKSEKSAGDLINPVFGLYYAVNRAVVNEKYEVVYTHNPVECLSIGEAIESYTWSAAWNGNNECRRGEIALWRDADLVIFNEDPFELEPHELANLTVNMTICGGRKIEQ